MYFDTNNPSFVQDDDSTFANMLPFFKQTDRLEALLAAHTYLYGLFYRTFSDKPDAELVDTICSPETISTLGVYAPRDEACANLRLYCKTLSYSTIQGGFMLRVNAEYARLFNLFNCTTSESAHIAPLCGKAALQLKSALDALHDGDISLSAKLLEQHRAFTADNVLPAAGALASRLSAGKTSFLYAQMARGLASFASIDHCFCDALTRTTSHQANAWLEELVDAEIDYDRIRRIPFFNLPENEALSL